MNRVCLFLLLILSGQLSAAEATLQNRDQAYRLQPSDQLQLTYRYSPEYDQTLTIEPDGAVTVDLVGSVNIGGLSLDEAKARIVGKLATRLNDPEVTLVLTDFVRPMYTVLGEVGAPGRFELRGSTSALDAVATAGGLKSSAKHCQVILFRREAGDMASTHLIDMKKMISPHHPDIREDIYLKPGDMLVVPKTRVSKISDYVHWVSVGSYIPF